MFGHFNLYEISTHFHQALLSKGFTKSEFLEMHHFWTVPELLDMVLNELENASLLNMARVCKAFWAPTVRLIWQLVPSFSNLLSLFPEQRQHVYQSNTPEFLALSGKLRRSEWERFRLHSPLVKELWMTLDESNFVTLQRMQTSSKEGNILPNLHTLSLDIALSAPPRQLAQVCKLILGPNLSSVACRYIGQFPKQDEAMRQLIDTLRSSLEHLEALCWRTEEMSVAAISHLSAVLPSFPELRSVEFSVNDLAPALVQAVAQVQKLERVQIAFLNDRESNSILKQVAFPSLKEMTCIGLKSAVRPLLLANKVPVLEALCLRLYGWWEDDEAGLFEGLGDPALLPFLTTLRVETPMASWEEMKPLLSLKGIKELNLDLTVNAGQEGLWSPSAVRLVAESFPSLEVLVLGSAESELEDSALKLPALDCFSQYCPQLRFLAVTVDARHLHTFKGSVVPHPSVQEVSLLWSEADTHEIEIAEVIS